MCNLIEEYKCANQALDDYAKQSSNDTTASCVCPSQCHSHVYQTTVSQSVASTFFIEYLQYYFPTYTLEDLRYEFAVLEVYYSSLEYLDVTMTPAYTAWALLCDIGGAMGLLLGATLLTLYETLEFVLQLAIETIKQRVKGRKKVVRVAAQEDGEPKKRQKAIVKQKPNRKQEQNRMQVPNAEQELNMKQEPNNKHGIILVSHQ